jgi:hypothetical protein
MKERKGKALCSCGKLTTQDSFWKPIYEWKNYNEIERTIFKRNILFWVVFYFPVLAPLQRLFAKTSIGKAFTSQFVSFFSFMEEYTDSKVFIFGQKGLHEVTFLASQNIPISIIHLSKHPLEFVSSLKYRFINKQNKISIRHLANVWVRYNKRVLEISERAKNCKYIHVDYYGFCRKTESILKNICLFLDIPFEKQMLHPHPHNQHIIGADSVTKSFSGLKKNLSRIEILNEIEIKKTIAVTGNVARKLKYDLSEF